MKDNRPHKTLLFCLFMCFNRASIIILSDNSNKCRKIYISSNSSFFGYLIVKTIGFPIADELEKLTGFDVVLENV